ncbi:MAG: tRNA (adenosine(37)-N6)-threonylcarbamoyltransferase complex dimerization subunit type 1 TsaB [Clostridiaceae bacterium]|nr:tRNA (adenosine(37)-N6)-threonylcarbamoyltransferase complex dimerization subunit type 1 TsaB [Clostridiaceae bacterium]
MKILALDTSSTVATVAVMDGEKLVGEYILNHKRTHSQKLMPMVDEILKSCDLTPKEMDVFGVSLGPGSFTGLRIGIASIKAMAQSLNKPVVGVSALEAMAFNLIYCKEMICPIIDAQRDMVYAGVYQWQQENLENTMEDQVLPIEDLLKFLKDKEEKIVFVGDAVEKFKELIVEKIGNLAVFPPSAIAMPRASSIGEITRVRAVKGEIQDFSEVLPIYMRKSQAEKQWEEKMKNRG